MLVMLTKIPLLYLLNVNNTNDKPKHVKISCSFDHSW